MASKGHGWIGKPGVAAGMVMKGKRQVAAETMVEQAVSLHGHLCPALALGVRLCRAVIEIPGGVGHGGCPRVVVGGASPLVDAAQAALGATLGNGRLGLAPALGPSRVVFSSGETALEARLSAEGCQLLDACPDLGAGATDGAVCERILQGDPADLFTLEPTCGEAPWERLDAWSGRDAVVMRPIGTVHSPLRAGEAPPRARADKAVLELHPELADALVGLELGSRLQVLFQFHRATSLAPLQQYPQGDYARALRGVWALRSPHRPNGIGLTTVRLLRIEGHSLHVAGLDAWDGSPVLDIKPYAPSLDALEPAADA